ncbi:universal stress protein [Devosia sp. PTR5]|uniref:Universal stress protein n=1 Tax=Devosia oryzisoli TaxID=2774138 RepID=A0A927FTS5_9HYPH|nr:universal stress protein [Devosia oryzisoli]MBD8065302.1 universal stress protein [Devosia oryzisoli]
MYSHIVCAIDGSDLSTKALRHSMELASKLGAKLTLVTVTEPSVIVTPGAEMVMVDTSRIYDDLERAKAEGAKKVLDDAKLLTSGAGLSAQAVHVPMKPPAEGILEAAREHGADLIVMGSHGRRGLGRLLLGSQAAEVLAHSDLPVLIIK